MRSSKTPCIIQTFSTSFSLCQPFPQRQTSVQTVDKMTHLAAKFQNQRGRAKVRRLVERNQVVQQQFACLLAWKKGSQVPRAAARFALIITWQVASCRYSKAVAERDCTYAVSKDAFSKTTPMEHALCGSRITDSAVMRQFHTLDRPGVQIIKMMCLELQQVPPTRWARPEVFHCQVPEKRHQQLTGTLS